MRHLDLPDRQDLRKLQQLREEQGELSAADERRLKTLQASRLASQRSFYRDCCCGRQEKLLIEDSKVFDVRR